MKFGIENYHPTRITNCVCENAKEIYSTLYKPKLEYWCKQPAKYTINDDLPYIPEQPIFLCQDHYNAFSFKNDYDIVRMLLE